MQLFKQSRITAEGARPPAVLYARVSTKEQEQGYSIPAQQELLRPYAAQLGFMIEQEFLDAETAKTTGRSGFTAMISYLKHHPGCRVLLVEKTDRLYRNFRDYLTIDELDLEIHLVKENVILTKDSRSADKFMHGIKVLMAKNYIDNLSEEVRKGLRTKASQGMYPSFAPPGYVNTVGPDGKRIITPDPVLGPIIRDLFTWFASGEYSLKSLARKAYEAGFRFRKSRNRVPVTTLHKTLRKRIYTGAFDYGGAVYQGVYEPLVTEVTWERCQEILDGRHEKKNRKVKHDFAFSGIVRCGHCGCSLVGEIKKGRYVYYHCTGYRGKCPEPYTRQEALAQQFAVGLRELVIAPEIIDWLKNELLSSDVTEQAAREHAVRRNQADLNRIERRLDTLYEDRLDGRIEVSRYDQKASEIQLELQRVRAKLSECQAPVPSVAQSLDLMALTSRVADLFLSQRGDEQRKLLRLVVDDASWQTGELRFSFRSPFEQLRLSNSATARNERTSGSIRADFDIWRRKRDSNPRASYPANGFQDRRFQPLTHSSVHYLTGFLSR